MSQISLRRGRFRGLWLAAFAWAVLAAGAAAQTPAQPVSAGGACEAPRYKTVLQGPITGMGQVEYTYFLQLDRACRAHKRSLTETLAGSPAAFNVCAHPPYAHLQSAKLPSAMSPREYDYFIEVDRECAAYTKTAGAPPVQPAQAQSSQDQPSSRQRFLTGLAVLGALIAGLVASL